MQLADLYLLGDQRGVAQKLAADVLPQAEAMGYAVLLERAQEHLSETTLPDRLRAHLLHAQTADEDLGFANTTDDEAHAFALDVLTERGIPPERLAAVERDVFASRDIARERLDWCRHIELIQDLRHLDHPSTAYASPLRYDGLCEELGYTSEIGIPDWRAVISDFKHSFCEGCTARSPKRGVTEEMK